jgi:hypothetical protein
MCVHKLNVNHRYGAGDNKTKDKYIAMVILIILSYDLEQGKKEY